jgi:hypothetical protein
MWTGNLEGIRKIIKHWDGVGKDCGGIPGNQPIGTSHSSQKSTRPTGCFKNTLDIKPNQNQVTNKIY